MFYSLIPKKLRTMAPARRFVILGLLAAALLGAIFSVATSGARPTEAAPLNQAVSVRNFSYSPNAFTAHAGDQISVTVTNAGPSPHTFTISGVTDSGQIAPGTTKTVQFTVSQPGNLTFFCTIHGASVMSGQITVQAAAPAGSTAPPAPQPPAPSAPRPNQPAAPVMRPPQTGDAGLLPATTSQNG
jgi:plastocyanin